MYVLSDQTLAEFAIAAGTFVLALTTIYLTYWARRQAIETRKASQLTVVDNLMREMGSRLHQAAYLFAISHKADIENPDRQEYHTALKGLWIETGAQLQPIDLLGSFYERIEAYIKLGLVEEEIIMPQVAFGALMVWDAIRPMVERNRAELAAIGVSFERLIERARKYAVLPKSITADRD